MSWGGAGGLGWGGRASRTGMEGLLGGEDVHRAITTELCEVLHPFSSPSSGLLYDLLLRDIRCSVQRSPK